jgi:hypothetical protein
MFHAVQPPSPVDAIEHGIHNVNTRFLDYDKPHCWQYDIRVRNLEEDLRSAGLTQAQANALTVHDFTFDYVDKSDKKTCREIVEFIERHEWLGKVPQRLTDRFVARHNGRIAGTIIMATPNSFSNLLGPDTKRVEKLIARGACISWSPKNLASNLIMASIRHMVAHTEFRVFTAYSDTEAKELGTVYQACNFIYLGKRSGGSAMFFDPERPEKGWFSDREFRKGGAYKRYAKELGIAWEPHWIVPGEGIAWEKMPSGVEEQLRQAARDYQARCERRPVPPKHKYAYILGRNKRETAALRRRFEELNPVRLPYPKVRGA